MPQNRGAKPKLREPGGYEVGVEPMSDHAVVIAGGGPTGLMLAGELALSRVDVAIVERRVSQDLAGSRAGGLHSRTIEVLDQRGIAERFVPLRGPRRIAQRPLVAGEVPRRRLRDRLWRSRRQARVRVCAVVSEDDAKGLLGG